MKRMSRVYLATLSALMLAGLLALSCDRGEKSEVVCGSDGETAASV